MINQVKANKNAVRNGDADRDTTSKAKDAMDQRPTKSVMIYDKIASFLVSLRMGQADIAIGLAVKKQAKILLGIKIPATKCWDVHLPMLVLIWNLFSTYQCL